MSSTKPYLIRAIYEWCSDEGLTPYLAVQVDERTRVPREFVRDGQIVLNISATATHQMMMGNDEITFQARFNGASFPVLVPIDVVTAVYAKENGQGMAFEVTQDHQGVGLVTPGDESITIESLMGNANPEQSTTEPTITKRSSHLTRVK
jgi:stringent starvation protein B